MVVDINEDCGFAQCRFRISTLIPPPAVTSHPTKKQKEREQVISLLSGSLSNFGFWLDCVLTSWVWILIRVGGSYGFKTPAAPVGSPTYQRPLPWLPMDPCSSSVLMWQFELVLSMVTSPLIRGTIRGPTQFNSICLSTGAQMKTGMSKSNSSPRTKYITRWNEILGFFICFPRNFHEQNIEKNVCNWEPEMLTEVQYISTPVQRDEK